ncbi:HPC2 Histone promoter control protein 2 [Candida maltosa Xu316]
MVSKYKTSFTTTPDDSDVIVISASPSPQPSSRVSQPSRSRSKSNIAQQQQTIQPKNPSPVTVTPSFISDQVKKYQTNIQIAPVNTSPSKTSINSIINLDDDESSKTASPTNAVAKRKRQVLLFDPKKRKATSPGSKNSSATPPAPPAPPAPSAIQVQPKPVQAKAPARTQAKQPAKVPLQQSPAIGKAQPTTATGGGGKRPITPSTTGKSDPVVPVKVAAPTVIDLLNSDEPETEKVEPVTTTTMKPDEKVEKANKEPKEKPEPPIIALNIPLIDPSAPQPGKAEVIVNVMKLAEEKYGWNVMHPKSKNAIDIMDDMIDDEDDEDNDDEEDIIEVTNPTNSGSAGTATSASASSNAAPSAPQSNQKGKELTEEQLYRQHEIKMVRKVGKYDFEDPFIDDEELQIEEDISSTKEGFFVYWGPLVDEKNVTKIKKKR